MNDDTYGRIAARLDGLDRRRFLKFATTGAVMGTAATAGCTGSDDDGGGDGGNDPADAPDPDDRTEGGTLVWGHSETSQQLDIHTLQTAASSRFLRSVHEPLVGLNHGLEPTTDTATNSPGLAEDWEVGDDRRTYTFTLRAGVTFHDGTELTSADVKYSFDRIRDPETGAANRDTFEVAGEPNVEAIETPDDRTVVIRLREVYHPFVRQLTDLSSAIIPEGSGPDQSDDPVGTGPFQFDFREQGDRARLAAYEDYWGEGPYLDAVEERTVTDQEQRITSLEVGDYDFINDIPLVRIDEIVESPDLQTETWTPLSFAFLNLNNAAEPFDDRDFRAAMDYAIDKEELVEGALFGHGHPIASPSFPDDPFRNDDLEVREQDHDRVAELLAASPYDPDDYQFTFKVSTNYPWHVDAAEIIRDHLLDAGLDVEIQTFTWGDWLNEVIANQDFRVAMVNFFGAWEAHGLYNDLWATDGFFNFRNVSIEAFDREMDAARRAESDAEAADHYREAQRIIHERVPDVMLWFRDGSVAAEPTVGGVDELVSPEGTMLNFRDAWLDD